MAIIREEHQQNYTVVPNDILNDLSLPIECKSLYAIIKMLSKNKISEYEEVIKLIVSSESNLIRSDIDYMIYELEEKQYLRIHFGINYGLKKTFNYIEVL